MRKTQLIIVFCFLILHSLSGQELKTIRVSPQWTPQSQFAGFYVADIKGFYTEEGIKVQFVHPSPSNSAKNKLVNGEADVITSQLIEAILYRDEFVPIVNIMQTSQQNSLLIVSRTPIDTITDLSNKRIGRWKIGFYEIATILDANNGLNIDWIPFIHSSSLFLSGAIDATLAMNYNEYFQILSSGRKVTEDYVFSFAKNGYNIPEDGIYTTEEFLESHKKELAAFTRATKKGWEYCRTHKKEALQIVMETAKNNNIKTNLRLQEWMLEKILNSQLDSTGKAPYTLIKEQFNLANDILYNNNFIFENIEYTDFVKTLENEKP